MEEVTGEVTFTRGIRFTIEFDGYRVAERLLEGVIFDVDVEVMSADEVVVHGVSVQERHKAYFEQFNKQMYHDLIKEYYEDSPYAVFEDALESLYAPEDLQHLVAKCSATPEQLEELEKLADQKAQDDPEPIVGETKTLGEILKNQGSA